MDDSKFFKSYVEAYNLIFKTHPTDYIYIKDKDFRYQAITENMLSLMGAESIDSVVNLTTSEIKHLQKSFPKFIEKFNRQDVDVSKTLKRGVYLEIVPNNKILPGKDLSKIMVIYKSPIVNPETKNFVGIHGQMSDLLWPNVIKTIFKLRGAKGLLLNHVNNQSNLLDDYPLTNIQHMVLFLCIHNYSYSEIALFLNEFGKNITPSRVNDYLEQLKLIFHVRNKTQLIEKAIGLNFHVLLPCDLFSHLETIKIHTEVASIVCCDCKLGNCSVHNTDDKSGEYAMF